MERKLQNLPIGVQSFTKLRERDSLYIDKTAILARLADEVPAAFLSRPRRFGKSLTLSTLEAMFAGRSELFKGLAAEEWVKREAARPSPVLRIDMSALVTNSGTDKFALSLMNRLEMMGAERGISAAKEGPSDFAARLIETVCKQAGKVVVLIDEYDKPLLDNICDELAYEEMRKELYSFYTTLKSCDEYMRFIMLTGITKLSKTAVFSGLNNLNDISMDESRGDIVGCTQAELEKYFSERIDAAAAKLQISREQTLSKIKEYYDGFCFDGATKLYNPFSLLLFFDKVRFDNYWYDSASPSFLTACMKKHRIDSLEEYRHKRVSRDFLSAKEISNADPESLLFQSGYLTIEKSDENFLVLDYPNKEVLDSLSGLYLATIYSVPDYADESSTIRSALRDGDISGVVKAYDTILAPIPYGDFTRHDEALYRSIFAAALRTAGITCICEPQSSMGRPDVVAILPECTAIFEFKLARSRDDAEKLLAEGKKQINEKDYAAPYSGGGLSKVVTAVVVIDAEKHCVTRWE